MMNDNQNESANALLVIEAHQGSSDNTESIVDLLAMPNGDDIEFEAPRLSGQLFNAAESS